MTMMAVIQMISGDDRDTNLAAAGRLLECAADSGAKLAVLPENFAGLSADPALRIRIAETDGSGPIQDAVAGFAGRLKLWIVAGTIPLRGNEPARPLASCAVYDDGGARVARYDKIHLFDVDIPESQEHYRESANTGAGNSIETVATPWGRLALAVCYDLRFPELFRHMSVGGMDLLALPAAFTYPTGKAHWRTLLRARAIENLCYVLAPAQTGEHPGGRRTYGHSMIVDPWGGVLAEAGEAEEIAMADVDLGKLERIRREFPVLEHRRLEVGRLPDARLGDDERTEN